VRLDVYDETIRVLRSAVDAAKLGREEKLDAVHELDRQARQLEAVGTGGPSFEQLVAEGWEAAGDDLPPTCAPPPRPRASAARRKVGAAQRSRASAQLVLPGLDEG
jgi:hypothetical protein